jgi:hypothetical protein
MTSPPDWNKRAAIGAWVAIAVAIILWLFEHIWPADPQHPMTFDFLRKSIVIPPWIASVIILGVVAITAAVMKWQLKRGSPSQDWQLEIRKLKAELAASKAQSRPSLPPLAAQGAQPPLAKPFKPFQWVDQKTLDFSWPEGLAAKIVFHSANDTYGFVLYVSNETAEYIASFRFEIAEATNWSEQHKQFLPNRAFKRREIARDTNLPPMNKVGSYWLIKVLSQNNSSCLTVGKDEEGKLLWPNNDPTESEIWRFTLAPSYDREERLGLKNTTGLLPVHFLVRWDRPNAGMQILEYE